MVSKLRGYLARRKRLSKYKWWEFTAGKLLEYTETFELAKTVRSQGATHFQNFQPKEYGVVFYRMKENTIQECFIEYPFSKKVTLSSWSNSDFAKKIPSTAIPIEELFNLEEEKDKPDSIQSTIGTSSSELNSIEYDELIGKVIEKEKNNSGSNILKILLTMLFVLLLVSFCIAFYIEIFN